MIETRVPVTNRPRHLVNYTRDGADRMHFSLQSVPGGGLTVVLEHGGEVMHRTINYSTAGRADVLRLTYSWDTGRGWSQLALERVSHDVVLLVPVPAPGALRYDDMLALVRPGADRYVAPSVQYVALSDMIEPTGPMPTLPPDTPIATPSGYRAIGDIRRGDTILTPNGECVPVLHVVSRQVPARGSFRPVCMRAPYFGLLQDIVIAPSQRLVLSGSEVEYLFGSESVLVPARHLAVGCRAAPVATGPVVTYCQLLLPRHEALIAAGTVGESLFIGRIRRKKDHFATSVLAGLNRASMPEHGRSIHPVLQAFEAIILAENRAA